MKNRLILLAGALLVAGVVNCGGGGSDSPSTPTAPPPPPGIQVFTVQVQDFQFDPKSIRINPGDTVRWVLQGQDSTHTSTARDMTWDSEFVFQEVNDAFEWTTTDADNNQTFEYKCFTHENSHEMKGSILVGDNAPAPDPGY